MADSRSALRELLCHCRIGNTAALRMAVNALLNNLNRYPGDRQSIWMFVICEMSANRCAAANYWSSFSCMKSPGANHAALVQPLVVELFAVHPFFDTPEPQIQNPACMFTFSDDKRSYLSTAPFRR